MPSFDIVSEVDLHEVRNAVDQSNREVGTRFDFKGSAANFDLNAETITMTADSEFQLQQMMDVLSPRLAKRGVDLLCLKIEPPTVTGRLARQDILVRQGLDTLLAKKIIRHIKDSKAKVQAAIQGEQVRVTGKKRDDLQEIIGMIKSEKWDMPLQFQNFRD
jgi:uncharacterized protein YajQ (UPF0234 family)